MSLIFHFNNVILCFNYVLNKMQVRNSSFHNKMSPFLTGNSISNRGDKY